MQCALDSVGHRAQQQPGEHGASKTAADDRDERGKPRELAREDDASHCTDQRERAVGGKEPHGGCRSQLLGRDPLRLLGDHRPVARGVEDALLNPRVIAVEDPSRDAVGAVVVV